MASKERVPKPMESAGVKLDVFCPLRISHDTRTELKKLASRRQLATGERWTVSDVVRSFIDLGLKTEDGRSAVRLRAGGR